MASTTNVLITGCNRGIGLGLLSNYLLRPNHIIIGTTRAAASATSPLHSLPHAPSTTLILVKLDSAVPTDASAAISALTSPPHNVKHLDVVIANAGISSYFGTARVTPVEEMMSHFTVNTIGPLTLFQAVAPLLDAAGAKDEGKSIPKFVVMSSGAGSISGVDKLKVENTAYGCSKAGVNFVVRRIHTENPGIVAFPINPGWLQTDLGNHAASGAGLKSAPLSVEDGVKGVIDKIDNATREETSGTFVNGPGGTLAW